MELVKKIEKQVSTELMKQRNNLKESLKVTLSKNVLMENIDVIKDCSNCPEAHNCLSNKTTIF